MAGSIHITAPAKLNLFLHITGKRPDGYHLLDSLVAFTEFGDSIDITPYKRLELKLDGAFAKSLSKEDPDANLVLRAARMLQGYAGIKQGARITLHKNIPVGAGLGGGSSDAAAALWGLGRFWNIALSAQVRTAMALQLGSDVPVCLTRTVSHMQGIGEQVTALSRKWDTGFVLLVNPRIELLTADVFRNFKGEYQQPVSLPRAFATFAEDLEVIRGCVNALEAPAIEMMPQIETVIAAIAATPGCAVARMSGSGATCFGLYTDEALARAAASAIERSHPDWWVQATRWYHGETQ